MKRGGKRLRRSRWALQKQALCTRVLAWALVLALTAPLCGTICVYAEAETGPSLCVHHTSHTEDCGYAPPGAGTPCTHVHDENCGYTPPAEGAPCTHVHDGDCGYVEAVEGAPCTHVHDGDCGYAEAAEEIPCDMDCQEIGEDGKIIHQEGCAYTPAAEGAPCTHVHDGDCGYIEAAEGAPCTHVHDGDCGYAEAAEGTPCTHVHDGDCGYAAPTEGSPCGYLCALCVTGWQWADEDGILTQDAGSGVWGLGLPGVSEDTPLTRETLETLLPAAVRAETAAGPQTVELAWDLEKFPESAYEGAYTLTASLTGDYVLTDSAPRLEVLAELGGGETYDLTPWAFNNWTWEGYDLQEDAAVGICIDGINSPAELKRALEQRLPQRIAVTIWGNKDTDGTSHFTPKKDSTREGWLTVFWNDLSSQLSQISDWRNDFTLYATPPSDNKFDYIVNDNSGNRIYQIPITISPFSLEGHTVPAADPLATTVNLFDYWVQTDGSKGNDILTKSDYHLNTSTPPEPVERTTVADWNNGINKGRLLLFGDGNIHAGFWNKGAGAGTPGTQSYGQQHAGMEGIVKPVLENGYPVINTGAMQGRLDDHTLISDWELCGDELDSGPGTAGNGAIHNSKDPKQNLSETVIQNWKSSGNSASLDYLFNPNIRDTYKRSYEDVKGLFQLDSRGYYYYDIRQNFAEYDEGSNEFILYDAPAVDRTDKKFENNDYTDERSTGNFFPFNKGAQVFTGIENGKLVSDETIQSHNERNKGGTPMNHHLGMTLTVDFRQPLNGMINMGVDEHGGTISEPMSFQFSGDDDVWVFIDDVLVLDLGGIHSEIFGTIDFSNGTVKIGQSWRTNGFPCDDDPLNPGKKILNLEKLEAAAIKDEETTLRALFANAGKEDNFAWGEGANSNTFASDTDHTLKMFFLERGNYDSSLAVRFNLQPQLYQQIKKVDQNGEALEGVEFQLFPATDLGEADTGTGIECLYTDSSVHSKNTFYVQQKPGSSALATLVTGGDGTSLFEREVTDRAGETKKEPFNFADRTDEYYILRETGTPAGYRSQPVDIVLRYDKATSMLSVANRWTTGAYACSVSNIIGVGRLTYGKFENGDIKPDNALPVVEAKQSGGLVIAVPMLCQQNAHKWEALYGSNLGGFQAVKVGEANDADSWRWAVLEAALRQAMDEKAPNWYFDWDEGNQRLIGTLSDLPGLASRYQTANDMRMVYGIVEPAALEALGIDISKPADSKTVAQLRYEALGRYAAEYGIEETLTAIRSVAISDNGSKTGFSFLNTDQFNRNFRSLIYIPNEQRELWVQKIDQDGKPRNGAVFGLYDNPACTGTPVQGTTAAVTMPDGSTQDGILIFSPKPSGTGHAQITWAASNRTHYYLKEIAAPSGCSLNPTVTPVVVGTYSIYADAGKAGDGVSVMAGVGRLTQTMRQYAMGNDVDITLQDITAFGQYQPSENTSVLPGDWQDMKLDTTVDHQVLRSMNLHFGRNAVVDYGLHDQDGGKFFKPFFVTDEGFIRARVQQNYQALTKPIYDTVVSDTNKDNLKDTQLTNLFSLLNIVVVTDQTSPDTETGKLTISKHVEGTGLTAADYTKNFSFTLTLTDAGGQPLSGSYHFYGTDKAGTLKNGDVFPLRHDESITILGLPVGTKFTVTERAETDWHVFPKSGTIGGTIADGQTSSAQFRNSRQPWPDTGALTISKSVTGSGDRSKDFTFTVTFSAGGSYPYSGSKSGSIASGGTITLRDGQHVTITGLPVGTAYSVTEREANQDGYATSSSGDTGTIKNGENADAAFSNYIEPEKPTPGTGSLTISKSVTGSGDRSKDFTFTVTFGAGGSYPYSGSKSGSIASGGTITLRDGQHITITGLPVGTAYSVTEREANQDGYATSSSGDTGTISGSHTAAFTNGKSGGGGGGGGGTTPPETPPVTPPPETPPVTPPPETPPVTPPPETPPVTPPETPPGKPELPDPNDPNSPPTITIWEEGVPTTYVRIWDPEKEEYVYVPEDEVPQSYMEIPETGDASGIWRFSALLSLLGLAALRPGRKKESEKV